MATTTTLTPITLVPNTWTATIGTLCVEDVEDEVQTFEITPTKSAGKFIIEIHNSAPDQGTLSYELVAGTGYANSSEHLTGTIAQGLIYAIQVEDAKFKTGGKITLKLTPANGIKLKTGHDCYVRCIQLT